MRGLTSAFVPSTHNLSPDWLGVSWHGSLASSSIGAPCGAVSLGNITLGLWAPSSVDVFHVFFAANKNVTLAVRHSSRQNDVFETDATSGTISATTSFEMFSADVGETVTVDFTLYNYTDSNVWTGVICVDVNGKAFLWARKRRISNASPPPRMETPSDPKFGVGFMLAPLGDRSIRLWDVNVDFFCFSEYISLWTSTAVQGLSLEYSYHLDLHYMEESSTDSHVLLFDHGVNLTQSPGLDFLENSPVVSTVGGWLFNLWFWTVSPNWGAFHLVCSANAGSNALFRVTQLF